MDIRIIPSRAVGRVRVPASKSVAHRLLILAAFTDGVSQITELLPCEDVLATLDSLAALGVRYQIDGNKITVYGKNVRTLSPSDTLNCRESASTLRFLLPVAMLTGKEVSLSGKRSLFSRPMNVYEKLFRKMGWFYEATENRITIKGGELPDTLCVRADISSQFITGLLLAYAISGKGGCLVLLGALHSRPYIELTLDALRKFGVKSEWENECTLRVLPSVLSPNSVSVESDASAAAFLEAFTFLGGEVFVDGLSENSLQGDRIYKTLFRQLETPGARIDLGACPDLGPILFALAAAKHGAVFTSTARLRYKESDRVAAMADELTKLGAKLVVREDEVEVIAHPLHVPAQHLDSHNDHRIAMSLAPLLSITGGVIRGAEAVKKSFPGFWECVRSLGVIAEEI